MDGLIWAFLCVLFAAGGFFYGKHIESSKKPSKKYDELEEDDLDNQKDLKIFKEDPRDLKYIKEELRIERETKKKLVDQYETEINYYKSLLDKTQSNFEGKIERHEHTNRLFEEIGNEMGPIVQIVDTGHNLSDEEEIDKALEKEIDPN